MYPAANQFVARWIPQQERGFVNGLIFAGVGAGSGLTPPLLTWLDIEPRVACRLLVQRFSWNCCSHCVVVCSS